VSRSRAGRRPAPCALKANGVGFDVVDLPRAPSRRRTVLVGEVEPAARNAGRRQRASVSSAVQWAASSSNDPATTTNPKPPKRSSSTGLDYFSLSPGRICSYRKPDAVHGGVCSRCHARSPRPHARPVFTLGSAHRGRVTPQQRSSSWRMTERPANGVWFGADSRCRLVPSTSRPAGLTGSARLRATGRRALSRPQPRHPQRVEDAELPTRLRPLPSRLGAHLRLMAAPRQT